MKLLIRLLIKIGTVILLVYLLPHLGFERIQIHADTEQGKIIVAIQVALLLSILNVTVKPIIQILALPITCLTLGLFSLVISAAMVIAADYIIDGFTTGGWWPALAFSITFSFFSSLVERFIED